MFNQRAATQSERVAVIGQGYVGLPVTLAFAEVFPHVVGFDLDAAKIERLRHGEDRTGEASRERLMTSSATFTSDESELKGSSFFVVAVPTPIDEVKRPDLTPLASACRIVGHALTPGAVVVYESTVYPGLTEEFCRPLLEEASGYRAGREFTLGYSPERINPGDAEHTLERVVKVVAGQDEATLERVAAAYGSIVTAGVHRASSIRVAEAAKVIENTQRDLNIALMNELALIFDRLGISTSDVLAAAGTKWNFLGFRPGLVGGHCIGVDPYYLTTKAEAVGYIPQVILAGRRINDGMGAFVGQKVVKLIAANGGSISGARVGVLGLTFKENVPDLRNSRVPDILRELREYGVIPVVHDPLAEQQIALHEYGIALSPESELVDLQAIVIAVAHRGFRELVCGNLCRMVRPGGVVADVRSMLDPAALPPGYAYWSL